MGSLLVMVTRRSGGSEAWFLVVLYSSFLWLSGELEETMENSKGQKCCGCDLVAELRHETPGMSSC